ncbi:hypothetical protein [Mycobacteroides saopaulense]|uniref:Uncharacterized protein n=1 Tax=Mycobacteroides saopaulense TaxID=1578165 RepID=A0ABX3BZC9_9MYCO|nr:hypothetical protein [Mycobacteroides saopaulense]OHT81599.1 hypothetical protein BKG68_21950 [Mycobacteroides saopaulense]OHU09127.1 hypothetical protein BKG73_13910 [Mycobacteroides saopaulense]
MASHISRGTGLAAMLLGAGLLVAPIASAAPSPPAPPGPPPGYDGLPYHNMPGRIGHQPGAYTYILGFWMRPRRVLDAAGTSAMSNTDSVSAEYGMPGSELGVEPLRNSTLGVAPGVRPESPTESIGVPNPAGGVAPGANAPGGLEDPVPGTHTPRPSADSESVQPKSDGTIAPGSLNSGPDQNTAPSN